jgi:ABC-type arginine transport system permease subunit
MFVQKHYTTVHRTVGEIVWLVAVFLTVAAAVFEPSIGSIADVVFLIYLFFDE